MLAADKQRRLCRNKQPSQRLPPDLSRQVTAETNRRTDPPLCESPLQQQQRYSNNRHVDRLCIRDVQLNKTSSTSNFLSGLRARATLGAEAPARTARFTFTPRERFLIHHKYAPILPAHLHLTAGALCGFSYSEHEERMTKFHLKLLSFTRHGRHFPHLVRNYTNNPLQ